MTNEHDGNDDRATSEGSLDDEAIRVLVTRLARPHRSGGRVIERASLLAAGADFEVVMAWIAAHGGEPEPPAVSRSQRGVHSPRLGADGPTPLRFVLPPSALG